MATTSSQLDTERRTTTENLLVRLKQDILTGKHPPDKLLPSEKDLARNYRTSRWSIRNALDALVCEGMVRKIPSKGNMVISMRQDSARTSCINIGVIADSFLAIESNYYLQRLMRELEFYALRSEKECHLVHEFVDMNQDNTLRPPRLITDNNIDGMIFIPLSQGGLNYMNHFIPISKPLISFGRKLTNSRISQMYIDHYDGGFRAAEYLLQIGHRRIAILSLSPYPSSPAEERLLGYHSAMAQKRVTVDSRWVIKTSDSYAEVTARLEELFEIDDPPTALFVADGSLLSGCLYALARLGKRMPDDLALVSYDGSPSAKNYSVPITTVRQPLDQAAERLICEIAQSVLSGYSKVETIVIPPELVLRQSCRPVRETGADLKLS